MPQRIDCCNSPISHPGTMPSEHSWDFHIPLVRRPQLPSWMLTDSEEHLTEKHFILLVALLCVSVSGTKTWILICTEMPFLLNQCPNSRSSTTRNPGIIDSHSSPPSKFICSASKDWLINEAHETLTVSSCSAKCASLGPPQKGGCSSLFLLSLLYYFPFYVLIFFWFYITISFWFCNWFQVHDKFTCLALSFANSPGAI